MTDLTNAELAERLEAQAYDIQSGKTYTAREGNVFSIDLRTAAARLRAPLAFRWEDIGCGAIFSAVLGYVTEDIDGGWHASVVVDGADVDLEGPKQGLWNTEEEVKAAFTSQVTGGGDGWYPLPSGDGWAPTAYMHEITEPNDSRFIGGYQRMFSASPENPWSHWTVAHLGSCVYKMTPLYALQSIPQEDA